jgi:ribosomal protein S18 acetylase RimI-like enzyme
MSAIHPMIIRRLKLDDASDFKALRIEAAQKSPESLYPDEEELTRLPMSEIEKQVVGSPFQLVFGAFLAGQLISIAGLRREAMRKLRHRAVICNVYTKEAHRGKGIARKLMNVVLSEARSNTEITMLNLSVHSQNAAAKALYASLGFVCYGTQHNTLLVNGQYVHEEQMELNLLSPLKRI